jgi:FdhE protein
VTVPLGKPWGRRPALPTAVASALDDLGRLIVARPELAGAGRSLGEVLRASYSVPSDRPISAPDAEALVTSWRDGVAAFRAAPPPLDGREVRARGLAICEVLRAENPRAAGLHDAARRGRADLLSWWSEILSGHPEEVARQADALGADPDLAASVLRLSLLPALARWSEAIARHRPEGLWGRGECPNCGAAPVLAESRGLEQRRALRCGLCAADWFGDRMRCPFCGETDHRAFRSRFVEGEQDRYRLVHCDGCGLALKVVSTLAALTAPGLVVAELATVHLDLIADEGY